MRQVAATPTLQALQQTVLQQCWATSAYTGGQHGHPLMLQLQTVQATGWSVMRLLLLPEKSASQMQTGS
jgi:hypothetical protein